MTVSDEEIAGPLLVWFDQYGRHDLPWQQAVTPYRVWVSEIMLQQTQVQTVIPYFERFMASFPTVVNLADAKLDDVLSHWAGLGYYARARNLHRAATEVCDHYRGRLPEVMADLIQLPGIGRSTAGAILALAHNQRQSILDGNVKRVLCRYQSIGEWSGTSRAQKQLWELAERYTPQSRVDDYTQAIMDLGATVCTRGQPQCHRCPLHNGCRAHIEGRENALPVPRPKRDRPLRHKVLMIIRDDQGRVLLQQRPPTGIWGGLWSLPECDVLTEVGAYCEQRLGLNAAVVAQWPEVQHGFTHFQLVATPLLMECTKLNLRVADDYQYQWVSIEQSAKLGCPAPIKRLLNQLSESINQE